MVEEEKKEAAAALRNLNNNILTSFMIIGINKYDGIGDTKIEQLLPKTEVKSQPGCSIKLYLELQKILNNCYQQDLIIDVKVKDQRIKQITYCTDQTHKRPTHELIRDELTKFQKQGQNQDQWILRILVVTMHGFIKYPEKESCICYVSEELIFQDGKFESSSKVYRYENLEHLARNCAMQRKTITIIVNNACREYFPTEQIRNKEAFISSYPYFEEDTNGTRSNQQDMPGIAIILFASRLTKKSEDRDTFKGSNEYENVGTLQFLKHIDECRREGKLGFEFLDKYVDNFKIMYSVVTLYELKKMNFQIFKPYNQQEQNDQEGSQQQMQMAQTNLRQNKPDVIVPQCLLVQETMKRKRETEELLDRTINQHVEEMNRGLITNDCYKAQKSRPLNEKWQCQGALRTEKCMSAIIKKSIQREIVVYKCLCQWQHRLCEACYLYYQVGRGQNHQNSLDQLLILIRPNNQLLFAKAYNDEDCIDYYFTYNPKVSTFQQQIIQMSGDNCLPYYFSTVIPLDSRFTFVVGGSLDSQENNEVQSENLVLIDTTLGQNKIRFKKNLTLPVIHAACSIFGKRLLFIAGGQSEGQWITSIQIYDIEQGKMYKVQQRDKDIGNIPVPLVGPSMSAEFFESLGLIICGFNPQTRQTEVYIYNTHKNKWQNIGQDSLLFERSFSFIGMHVFSIEPNNYFMLLMGGINLDDKQSHNKTFLYQMDQKGSIEWKGGSIFNGKGDQYESHGDFFPQNQWIVIEDDNNDQKSTKRMYVLGRRGTYFLEVKIMNDQPTLGVTCYADEGFDRYFQKYIV